MAGAYDYFLIYMFPECSRTYEAPHIMYAYLVLDYVLFFFFWFWEACERAGVCKLLRIYI